MAARELERFWSDEHRCSAVSRQAMRRRALTLFMALGWSSTACKGKLDPVRGSGVQRTETRALAEFHKLKISGNLQVEVVLGSSSPSCELTTDDNLLGSVSSKLEGDTLVVRTSAEMRPRIPVRVRLATGRLDWLGAEGAAQVNAGKLAGNDIEAQSAGAAKMTLSGAAGSVRVHTRTASQVELEGLAAGKVFVKVDHASRVNVGHAETLDVVITGPGHVSYRGEPQLTRNVSKLGSVTQAK